MARWPWSHEPQISGHPCGTIYDIHAAYRSNKSTPEIIYRSAVHKARASQEYNEWIHIVSDRDIDKNLRALKSLDPDLPLYGIPFAVKDNIDVEGVPTTMACPSYSYIPERSAVVVSKLKAAGALFVGKNNLDQFATGLVGSRSPFGPVRSTWSAQHVSGGSSSGSATVVSKGVVPFTLGTDTAGSGRVPAAFNGIVGLKPSLGRVSNSGVFPACPSLDCVNVFALTASDAALVLKTIEISQDESGVRFSSPPQGPKRFSERIRVGVPWEWPQLNSSVSSDDFRERFSSFKEAWKNHGEIELIDFDMGVLSLIGKELYEGPWIAERYSSFQKAMENSPEEVDPTVFEIMRDGNDIKGVEVFKGIHTLQERKLEANRIWEQVDVILVPSTPHHPTLSEVASDPILVNRDLGSFTNFVNFLGWSALAMPVHSGEETPFGVTWIAPPGYDVALIEIACRYAIEHESKKIGSPSYSMEASPQSFSFPTELPLTKPTMKLAVVGAHLKGMPLHHELQNARAQLRCLTTTSDKYKLYKLNTVPPKPALIRSTQGGTSIEIEIYDVPLDAIGVFLLGIPHPLGLGSIECEDNTWVHGFIAEPCAVESAIDISNFGGWRAAMEHK